LTSTALDGERFQIERFVDEATCAFQQSTDEDSVLEPGAAASLIAGLFDAQGPNSNFTAACVSCSKAIGESTEIIRRGDADVMLAGGAHSMIHPFGVTGFHRLSTLSTRNDEPEKAARPFDRERDGFVIGEGGVMLVLEELDFARRRGAEIWAEVAGWGVTHDAYRITDLDPGGRSAVNVIARALDDARMTPDDIDYINAHGSGTAINDKTETLAVKKAFGERAYHVPMSGTKSMTGHLTTACGAIESLACLVAIRDGVAPPTINYENPDPYCDLDYVPNTAREISCKHAMNNSFGFGGQNVVLVLSRFEG
jgi:3-oxoacyl-[acyl-carrier-protein] synthase II